ncbi:hypothetical protein PGT21_011003 [Puccinia graminis f. sp. tritici]|uniref:Uncharacterized protein n=1 Tax=Puccinia graminis f. sp. tritici TaxID=56615 RepID=A0A5B0LQG4_PUCGR|nr:hypothetical protein PGT21_011003 [Puccinia graminis f. sp. tritici]
MTKMTRSNRPELRSPLPAPTRPRGGKGATGSGRKPPDDDLGSQREDNKNPREVEANRRPSSECGDRDAYGRGRDRIRIVGSYPDTPFNSGDPSSFQRRTDQTPGERARIALEKMSGSYSRRPYSYTQSLVDRSSGESEDSPEAYRQRGNRKLREGMEPMGQEKDSLPAPPKKQTMKFKRNEPGKRQSSSSINFADPAKWKKATELLQIAAGLYQNMQ